METASFSNLDSSKLTILLTDSPKEIPKTAVFGETYTNHMLVITHDPVLGWSAPEIKPYGPLSLDPASAVLHYSPTAFEGMKAYLGPDGEARLFRPELNMKRFARSASRVLLPEFDQQELLKLIKKLVSIDQRWIPSAPGHSLYIRPTYMGTRPSVDLGVSNHAMLFVILTPVGPYFKTGQGAVSLLATESFIRAWPGGTGEYKLGCNYAPGYLPQEIAVKEGFKQILWIMGEEKRITEVGGMNFFVVVQGDKAIEVITPPLDGTILPGITRDSCLSLLAAHAAGKRSLLHMPSGSIRAREGVITMGDIQEWTTSGKLLEAFVVGTAASVAPVGTIGYAGKNIAIPSNGQVTEALRRSITDIQHGVLEWEDWSIVCE